MKTDTVQGRRIDVPPTADEPLDEIQVAFVRALVPAIAAAIRQELIDEQQTADRSPRQSAGKR